MSVIFVLIGFSLIVALGFLFAFIWSIKDGQYEDDYTPSVRILFENKNGKQSGTTEKEKPDKKPNHK